MSATYAKILLKAEVQDFPFASISFLAGDSLAVYDREIYCI